jgi:hypothetical protein
MDYIVGYCKVFNEQINHYDCKRCNYSNPLHCKYFKYKYTIEKVLGE